MKTEYATLKISRETAERWYNGDNKELKGLALTSFPDLEQIKPVVGEWYWDKSGCLYRCKSIEEDKVRYYNYWFDDKLKLIEDSVSFFCISQIDRIATEQEIFEAFDKEARKRGYYEKRYKHADNNEEITSKNDYTPLFSKSANWLWINTGIPWKDGKWAEFVDDFKEGEMLAFSDRKDWSFFIVGKFTGKTKDGKFASDGIATFPFAKRIKYELL